MKSRNTYKIENKRPDDRMKTVNERKTVTGGLYFKRCDNAVSVRHDSQTDHIQRGENIDHRDESLLHSLRERAAPPGP